MAKNGITALECSQQPHLMCPCCSRCCCALQIALAGNCVYEQTGQGSTQETRNKTQGEQQAARQQTLPRCHRQARDSCHPHPLTHHQSSPSSPAARQQRLMPQFADVALPLLVHTRALFLCHQLDVSLTSCKAHKERRREKQREEGKRTVGVAFGNCKCNHKTYHYIF